MPIFNAYFIIHIKTILFVNTSSEKIEYFRVKIFLTKIFTFKVNYIDTIQI